MRRAARCIAECSTRGRVTPAATKVTILRSLFGVSQGIIAFNSIIRLF